MEFFSNFKIIYLILFATTRDTSQSFPHVAGICFFFSFLWPVFITLVSFHLVMSCCVDSPGKEGSRAHWDLQSLYTWKSSILLLLFDVASFSTQNRLYPVWCHCCLLFTNSTSSMMLLPQGHHDSFSEKKRSFLLRFLNVPSALRIGTEHLCGILWGFLLRDNQ